MHEQTGLSRPARVLLVEDDPRAAKTIGDMLRAIWPDGVVVSQTAHIADAAQELLDFGATCVLLDLPRDTSPVQALEPLTAASARAPIIVLSARSDEELGVAAVKAGAQDFLPRAELTPVTLGRAMRYAVERKRSEVELAHRALHDPLTELPNRALFLDRLRGALDRSRRTGAPVTVLFLDVDGFKDINDTLGHPSGDLLLTVLADRFRALLRPMDTVARYGGDEFTFLLEGLETEDDAAVIAERISRTAARPLPPPLGGGEPERRVGVSIGVTMVSDPAASLDDVIGEADSAMYRAKELGGQRYELAGPGERRSLARRVDLEADLRQAIARSQLRVHYQPRVRLNGQAGLAGFEALVRWEHPERGLIAPAEFIPVAEHAGLIAGIDDWVLQEGLTQVRRWRRSRPEVTISVNLSGHQLEDPSLPGRLSAVMSSGGDDPAALCLEVAAGAVAHRPQAAAAALTALHALGVELALDNFGTELSAVPELEHLPIDILKIDRSLVSGLGRRRGDGSGVQAAVALGHTLGLTVVADGVETDAQLAALRELGCDGAQGFLFSRPITGQVVCELLGSR